MSNMWVRILIRALLIIVVATALILSSIFIWEKFKMPKIHTLEFPLLLEGSGEKGRYYLLPKGTTLYFDKSYPEGFVRYKIFVNVDRFPLHSTELADPTEIRPITAFGIDKSDLKRLLSEYPLSKDDLVSILKSGQLSKEEIRETLAEFSR